MDSMSPADIDAALEHGPPPGPTAHGLVGWRLADGREYCVRCVSRLLGRGFTGALGDGAEPIWAPQTSRCDTKQHR